MFTLKEFTNILFREYRWEDYEIPISTLVAPVIYESKHDNVFTLYTHKELLYTIKLPSTFGIFEVRSNDWDRNWYYISFDRIFYPDSRDLGMVYKGIRYLGFAVHKRNFRFAL